MWGDLLIAMKTGLPGRFGHRRLRKLRTEQLRAPQTPKNGRLIEMSRQLFINLSNEILQSHFNQHFFRMELQVTRLAELVLLLLQEYEAEGIKVGIDIQYQDNSDIVSLINAKGGILSILDDEAERSSIHTFRERNHQHLGVFSFENH